MDVWGVLYDSRDISQSAVRALEALQARGIAVALVSNTSRRSDDLRRLLKAAGCPEGLLKISFTAGDLAYEAVAGSPERGWPLGRRCLPLGWQPGGDWLDEAGLTRVAMAADADFALAQGVVAPDAAERTLRRLDECAALDLALVVSNPDETVQVDGVALTAAGALARAYASRGGRTLTFGKPEPRIFAAALNAVGCAAEEAMMLGDGWATDGLGAAAAGIPFVFVGQGPPPDRLCRRTLCGRLSELW